MKITLASKEPSFNDGELVCENLMYDCSSYSVGLGAAYSNWKTYRIKFLALLYTYTSTNPTSGHNKFVFSYEEEKTPSRLFNFLKKLGAKRKTMKVPGWTGNTFYISVVTLPKDIRKWKYNPFAERWPQYIDDIKIWATHVALQNTYTNFSWLSDVKVGGE